MVNPIDTELLEPLDRAHDIHERVQGPHLVQSDLIRRHTVDTTLRLAEKLERLDRAGANPLRQWRASEDVDQLADVSVRCVVVVVGVGV